MPEMTETTTAAVPAATVATSTAQQRRDEQNISLPEALRPPLNPEPDTSLPSASPTAPMGPRWTADRGAIPGEPSQFLDGDAQDAKAAITEIETPKGMLYEATSADGDRIGTYGNMATAARAAEYVVDARATGPFQNTGQEARQKAPLGDAVVLSPLRDAARSERERTLSGTNVDQAQQLTSTKPTAEEELSRKTVALALTEEQTRLLLVAEYPNDTAAVYRGMFEITNTDNSVNIMNENVSLDYEQDRRIFYAQMEREEKPAFLEKLDDVLEQNYRLTHPKQEPVPTQNKGIGIGISKTRSKQIELEPGA